MTIRVYLSPKSCALDVAFWSLQALHVSVPIVFSERNGYRRFPLRIGQWRIGINRRAGSVS